MTRQEQDYYHSIDKQTTYLKRIAEALENIVNKERDDRLKAFKNTANLLYGNDATVNPNKGRSDDNYTYPQFVDKHYAKSTMDGFQPNITSELDERIHKESQLLTGGEFQGWYTKLSGKEKQSYARIYGND